MLRAAKLVVSLCTTAVFTAPKGPHFFVLWEEESSLTSIPRNIGKRLLEVRGGASTHHSVPLKFE